MRFSLVMWNAVFWRALWNVADMCLKTVTHVCLRVFENSNLLYTSLKRAACEWSLHVSENSNLLYTSLKRATCEWSLHVSENSSLCMEFTRVWKKQPVNGVYMCLKTAACVWSLHVSENSNLWMEFTCVWKQQPVYGVYTCLKRPTHVWSLYVVWKEQPMHGVYSGALVKGWPFKSKSSRHPISSQKLRSIGSSFSRMLQLRRTNQTLCGLTCSSSTSWLPHDTAETGGLMLVDGQCIQPCCYLLWKVSVFNLAATQETNPKKTS